MDPKPQLERICGTCRYWDGARPDNGELVDAGLCRFNAPAESARVGYKDRNGSRRTFERGTWPLVFGHDWCGEWTEARPELAFGLHDGIRARRPDRSGAVGKIDGTAPDRLPRKIEW